MLPIPDDHLAADDNVVNVGGGGSETDLIRPGAGGTHRVSADHDEVGEISISDPAAFWPAQTAVPDFGTDHNQVARSEAATFAGGEPLVEFESTHLLERVDHSLLVRAEGQWATCAGQPPSRTNTVSKITLGGRTEACRRLATTQHLDVGVGEVSGVYRGGATPQQTVIIKQLGRSPTVEGPAGGVLGRLFAEVDMQRTLPCRFTDLAECLGRYGAN